MATPIVMHKEGPRCQRLVSAPRHSQVTPECLTVLRRCAITIGDDYGNCVTYRVMGETDGGVLDILRVGDNWTEDGEDDVA